MEEMNNTVEEMKSYEETAQEIEDSIQEQSYELAETGDLNLATREFTTTEKAGIIAVGVAVAAGVGYGVKKLYDHFANKGAEGEKPKKENYGGFLGTGIEFHKPITINRKPKPVAAKQAQSKTEDENSEQK